MSHTSPRRLPSKSSENDVCTCAIPIIGLGYALSHVEASSWLMFAGEAAFMCGAFGIEAYFVCLAPNERAVLAQRVSAVFQREAAVNEV